MSKFGTALRLLTPKENRGGTINAQQGSTHANAHDIKKFLTTGVEPREGFSQGRGAHPDPSKAFQSQHQSQPGPNSTGPSLTHLIGFESPVVSLKGMEINGELCKLLCSALSINESVREIDLSNNFIGDNGADAIASMLMLNPNIESLNLSKNHISPWGAVRIVRGCRKHQSVQSLNLSGNNVGDSGLSELGRWIALEGCNLRELVLADSQIGFDATVGFAEFMLSNQSLLYLSVPHSLGFTLIEELQKLLQRNWALFHKLDEQVEIANTVIDRLKHQTEMRNEKWESDQKQKEPKDARTQFLGGTMEEWSDPDTASTLLYLNVLERKAPPSNKLSGSLSDTGRGSTSSSSFKSSPRRPQVSAGAFGNGATGKAGSAAWGGGSSSSSRFPPITSPRTAR